MEYILDVNRINKSLEDLVNKIALFHLPGDVITLSYSVGNVEITIK